MKKAYDEIMDNIHVNDAMRSRILQNIAGADVSFPPPRQIFSPRRWAAAAACIALLVISGLVLQTHTPMVSKPPTHDGVTLVSPIVTADTLEDLEQAVDFPVEEAVGLPFSVEETTYRSISREIAEITYAGQGQTATLRKSFGTEDLSGDYTRYPETISLELGEVTGELRGSDGAYILAVWSNGDYAWSLGLSEGMDESAWITLISGISG